MQNLIKFLARNGVFLVFLALEFLCFNLVIRNNQKQSEIYHNASLYMTSALQKRASSISDFWDLRRINDSLRVENSQLRSELINRIAGQSAAGVNYKSNRTRFDVIPARVIQNSIGKRNNYFTLDRGAAAGISPGMGVVSDDGPVGIVVAATPGFSRVMSILHSNTMLSASIRSKGYFGSLVWRSANPRRMELDAIPKHAQMRVGDTVVTSGYSKLFPPDVIVGTIDTFWLPRGSNFYRARVLLNVDMAVLHSAYVIEDIAGEELDSLQTIEIHE